VQSTTGGGSVDHADELAVLRLDPLRVAVRHGRLEPLRQRLDGGAVAEVLEPLAGGDPDALLLLSDVRHDVKKPAPRAARS
jgi:hypothetical protein